MHVYMAASVYNRSRIFCTMYISTLRCQKSFLNTKLTWLGSSYYVLRVWKSICLRHGRRCRVQYSLGLAVGVGVQNEVYTFKVLLRIRMSKRMSQPRLPFLVLSTPIPGSSHLSRHRITVRLDKKGARACMLALHYHLRRARLPRPHHPGRQ